MNESTLHSFLIFFFSLSIQIWMVFKIFRCAPCTYLLNGEIHGLINRFHQSKRIRFVHEHIYLNIQKDTHHKIIFFIICSWPSWELKFGKFIDANIDWRLTYHLLTFSMCLSVICYLQIYETYFFLVQSLVLYLLV